MIKNYREKIASKNGIAMVTLVITIIVGLILVSAGIVTVSNSISDATITAFANDLNTIQDQVNLYYMQNDTFPVYEGEDAVSQGEILSLITEDDNKETFKNELTLNGDYNTSDSLGVFYIIDLSKLNVEKTVRGTKEDGDESDVYVVSYPSMNVYYLKGIKVSGEVYFSLSSKIIKYTKNVESTVEDTSSTDVISAGSLSVKKIKKSWTNKMGITLTAYMNAGESLYLKLPEKVRVDETLMNTSVGNNTFIFDSFNDLNGFITTPKLISTEMAAFNSITGEDKYIEIVKKDEDNNEIDKLKVDLSNYDVTPPVDRRPSITNVANDFLYTEQDQEKIIRMAIEDTESGIKEVRYDYLSKYNEDGVIEQYYSGVDDLEGAFLKARGKKAKIVSNGAYAQINFPKDICQIQILVLDKADNWRKITTSLSSSDRENILSSFYIGTTLKSINKKGAVFKVAFNRVGGISSYDISVSTDGSTYSSPVTKTPSTTSQEYSEIIRDFENGLNITDNLYIKVIATDNSSVTQERIFIYSLEDAKDEYTEATVVDGVTIPIGFVASQATGENTKAGGLVIYEGTEPVTDANVDTARTTRNQFVWVPVEVPEGKTFEEVFVLNHGNDTEPYLSSGVPYEEQEYNKMYASVKEYNGFYIGRYEAARNDSTGIAEVKKGLETRSSMQEADFEDRSTWNLNLQRGGAIESARAMYKSLSKRGAVSTLIYGVQWDATLNFIESAGYDVYTDSTSWGNYSGSFTTTGTMETSKAQNIYDLAGNCREWTMEYNGISTGYMCRILRGNEAAPISGSILCANYRDTSNSFAADTSFRVALYMN